MNKFKLKYIALGFIIISSPFKVSAFNDTGDIDFNNRMHYKEITKKIEQTRPPELDEFLSRAAALKKSGQWDLDNTEMEQIVDKVNGGQQKITLGRNSGGLNSISPKYKQTYTQVSPEATRKVSAATYKSHPYYSKVMEDNLATQFDISSPGSLLSATQWKQFIASKKPTGKQDYILNGQKVNMYQKDMMAKVVDGIFRASMDYFTANGKTINPDFLIALSIHETGWGSNTVSRLKNGWFSVNATNLNTLSNARSYPSPYESVYDAIKLLSERYTEGGKFFDTTKGSSMVGVNTYYSVTDGNNAPNFDWSYGISNMIKSATSYNNVKIPTF